jgi:hypothetical protein
MDMGEPSGTSGEKVNSEARPARLSAARFRAPPARPPLAFPIPLITCSSQAPFLRSNARDIPQPPVLPPRRVGARDRQGFRFPGRRQIGQQPCPIRKGGNCQI